jgi:tetratricopeptide (TPR) repeat protein
MYFGDANYRTVLIKTTITHTLNHMKKNLQFVLALLALIVVACQSPKEKALLEIEALQAQDSVFSIENMAKEKDVYIAFADKYPDDERAPEFLFKAGQSMGAIASQKKDMTLHEESIAIFKRIQDHYAEEALFLTGFVYENHMGNIAKAKATYQEFIDKYPKSELAEDAQFAIENLGISPEDIIKRAQEGTTGDTSTN